MKEEKHSSRIMKWSLIVGIVIVMNLFFNYAISLAYKAPDYNAYFSPQQIVPDIGSQQNCIAVGGQWTESLPVLATDKTAPQGYCDPNFKKQQQFDAAQKHYDRIVFILLVVLGVAAIVTGAFFENEVLSLAFSWGGVLSLFIASLRYWSDASNILKVIILAIALGTLIWTAIRKFA